MTALPWFTLTRHDILDKPTSTVGIGPDDALKLVGALTGKLNSTVTDLDKWDRYYRGTQPLSFLHPEIALTVGDRLKSMVINWCRVALDSLEERLNVDGFRLGDAQTIDAQIAQLWQRNDFDLGSGRTHHASMRHGRAFVSVWAGDDGPRLAVESARQTVVSYEPGTQIVNAGLKKWQAGSVSYANLYLPDRVVKYVQGATPVVPHKDGNIWQVTEVVDNPLGIVPLIPFLNRYDLDMPDGESELADIAPLVDAINKLATDMMVSSEFHAMPRRWATGIEIQQGEEGERTKAEAKAYWERATAGKVWMAGQGVSFGQFAVAELANFTNAIEMLTANLAAIAGLPPHYMGLHNDNPASADAIRSAEAALIKRAQRKQRSLGEAWEDTITLATVINHDGEVPAGIETLETVWGDPATPTIAQMADAAMKLTSGGIIDFEQAQEDLGYSANQIERMRVRRVNALAEQATAEMRGRVAAALDLIKEYGIEDKVAFAAVGLITPPRGTSSGPEAPPPVPGQDS